MPVHLLRSIYRIWMCRLHTPWYLGDGMNVFVILLEQRRNGMIYGFIHCLSSCISWKASCYSRWMRWEVISVLNIPNSNCNLESCSLFQGSFQNISLPPPLQAGHWERSSTVNPLDKSLNAFPAFSQALSPGLATLQVYKIPLWLASPPTLSMRMVWSVAMGQPDAGSPQPPLPFAGVPGGQYTIQPFAALS